MHKMYILTVYPCQRCDLSVLQRSGRQINYRFSSKKNINIHYRRYLNVKNKIITRTYKSIRTVGTPRPYFIN